MQKNRPVDIRTKSGIYSFRFSNFFDQEAKDFEDLRIRKKVTSQTNDECKEWQIAWPQVSYWQSYRYFIHQNNPFYFLQMTNSQQNRDYQLVVRMEVSSLSIFKIGIIEKWAINPTAEIMHDLNTLLDQLHYFIEKYTDIMSLRYIPYLPGGDSINMIHQLFCQKGLKETTPTSYTKTRMINLLPGHEELLKSFSANGRARLKIKENDKGKIEIKEVRDGSLIPHLQNALNASYKRSADKKCPYNFFPLLKSNIEDVLMLGFFFKEELAPKAFATGVFHQSIAEFSVGGSLEDATLRQYPFNHLLLWNLALKAKSQGMVLFDMGGISSGDDSDPLKGITNFKRMFPGFEIQTGFEMLKVFKPRTLAFYKNLQKANRWIKQ